MEGSAAAGHRWRGAGRDAALRGLNRLASVRNE